MTPVFIRTPFLRQSGEQIYEFCRPTNLESANLKATPALQFANQPKRTTEPTRACGRMVDRTGLQPTFIKGAGVFPNPEKCVTHSQLFAPIGGDGALAK